MTESYLKLSRKDQSQILRSISGKEGIERSAIILEKDIWLCWALEHLFKMPGRLPMAFKGGTSLSKVYRVIERFSEDVDITVDYKSFECDNPFEKNISGEKIKKISNVINSQLTKHIQDIIIPYFEKIISNQFETNAPSIKLDTDGQTLYLHYHSSLESKSSYVSDSIRLEFGGRNLIIPNNPHEIKPDIADHIETLEFPAAQVTVIAPERTFWEKITLIHSQCNRTPIKEDANRISRHWYDVAKLAGHSIGIRALKDTQLFAEVIRIEKILYRSTSAKYDDCLAGKLLLIPNEKYLQLLKDDFNKMLDEKMFYGVQPDFENILADIEKLEKNVNYIMLNSDHL